MKYKTLLIIFLVAFLSSTFLSQGYACNEEGVCETEESSSFLPDKITNGYIGMGIFFFLSITTYLQIQKPTKNKKRHNPLWNNHRSNCCNIFFISSTICSRIILQILCSN